MRSYLSIVPTILLARTALAQSGACYFQNGTQIPDTGEYTQYKPCTSGPSTICCGINRDNESGGDGSKGFTKDECLPNGLCQNRVVNNGATEVSYWVDFCAESDPTNPGCLNVCDQLRGGFGNTALTPCDGTATSERWCCGGSTACCGSNVGVVTLAQVLGGNVSSSAVSSRLSSTTLSSRVSSSTSLASSSASTTPNSSGASATPSGTSSPASTSSAAAGQTGGSSGLSGGAIAGIVIGAIAGLALLAAAIFFWRRANMYKKKAEGTHYVEAPAGQPPQYRDQAYPPAEKYSQQTHSSAGNPSVHSPQSPPTELPPSLPSELPSSEYSAPGAASHKQGI